MSLSRKITVGEKDIDVGVTVADQIVNYFSPIMGAERFRARVRMALSGGYQAADRTRRANQRGVRSEGDADSVILPDLAALREESQHAIRNSPIAGGAIRTNITKVVGTGLKVKSQIDRDVLRLSDDQANAWERAAEREFRLATETCEIDVERQLPFSLLQGLVFLKVLEDGDLLVNMPRFRRRGSPYSLKLQLIEAARICNPDRQPDSATLSAGIQKDAATGAAIAYHVLNRHPGSIRRHGAAPSHDAWQRITAFSATTGDPLALFIVDKQRPGQTRGVPYLAPVVELIKQLGRYTDAEVMAAVVTGMLTVFVTNDMGSPVIGTPSEVGNPTDTGGIELGYGKVIGMVPGEKIETVNPNRPNTAFDPFVLAVMRQIGVALELPFELLVKHFTASYSAARAALEEAWSYFRRRRHWLVSMLCQPVYVAVISEAVVRGRLAAPGFFSDPIIRRAWLGSIWTGDAQTQIDPVKEVEAAKQRVEMRISTLDEEAIRLTGVSWEDKLPRIMAEQQVLRDNDLLPVQQNAAAGAAGEKKKDDEEEEQ